MLIRQLVFRYITLNVLPARPAQSLLFKQSGYISVGFIIMISTLVLVIIIVLLVFRDVHSVQQYMSNCYKGYMVNNNIKAFSLQFFFIVK